VAPLKNPRAQAVAFAACPSEAGARAAGTGQHVVTKPAATALRLRPLLKSAEIEELRRGGSNNAEQHPHRDGQRKQRAASGKDAQLF